MIDQKTADNDHLSVSFARQPVFDELRRLWGYELFCVGSSAATRSGLPEEPNTAVSVESSAYVCLQQIFHRGKKVIVDFNEKSILEKLPYALPPVLAAVRVPETSSQLPPLVEALSCLKSDGYLIAIDGFSADPACAGLYRLADIISLEVFQNGKDALAATLTVAKRYNALLLARRVHDLMLFRTCQELGFSLFHGAFFKSPDKVTVRKLSSNEALRFSLLRLIEQNEPDFTRLAENIQADATISFRLLAYLNSAAFAFCQRIKSIHQAITLLGWRKVKNWLRVVLLTDMSQSKDAYELVLLSAQRGMFLELIAREHDFWGFDPESLHLLGIFSLLDALLALPMAEIVANLPLDNKMKAALCREPNNEYLPLLHLAQCLEEARWAEGERLIQQLSLNSRKVKAAFQISVSWASDLDSAHSINP
jgi:EAL and modified HD-GYP domain-containing signal transduction protein